MKPFTRLLAAFLLGVLGMGITPQSAANDPDTLAFLEENNAYCEFDSRGRVRILTVASRADDVLERLRPLDHLIEFNTSFVDSDLTDRGLALLAEASRLEEAFFEPSSNARITPHGVRNLTKLKRLRKLVWGLPAPEDVMEVMGELRSLRELHLAESGVTHAGLRRIVGLENLEKLYLENVGVDDAGTDFLPRLRKLRVIDLEGSRVGDATAARLAKMEHLREISLGGTRVTDNGLKHLASLEELRFLGLSRTKVTDDGVKIVSGLRKLEFVGLGWTDVTDEGIKVLAELPKLETVIICHTRVTADGARWLQSALPPDCEIVHESNEATD